MTDIKFYLVGGAVRDKLLGLPVKDFDYSVVVNPELELSIEDAYEFMVDHLRDLGYSIFLETPQFLTIRAKFPKDHPNRKITADFVLARREGAYSDGRRPDWVKPGTLEDDLARRDFTVNAMAEDEDGNIIDLFGGQKDLEDMMLVAVGDPRDRFLEDPLRVYRALRFKITKGFELSGGVSFAMRNMAVIDKMKDLSADRIRDELHRCFAHDSFRTMHDLINGQSALLSVALGKGIWFEPTSKLAPGIRGPKVSSSGGVCSWGSGE